MYGYLLLFCIIANVTSYSLYLNVIDEEWETYKVSFYLQHRNITHNPTKKKNNQELKIHTQPGDPFPKSFWSNNYLINSPNYYNFLNIFL